MHACQHRSSCVPRAWRSAALVAVVGLNVLAYIGDFTPRAADAFAQAPSVRRGTISYVQETPPDETSVDVGDFWMRPTTGDMRVCISQNPIIWSPIPVPAQSMQPGAVVMILAGTCGQGWEEVDLNNKMLVGTLAANGDIGTSPGRAEFTGNPSRPTIQRVIYCTRSPVIP